MTRFLSICQNEIEICQAEIVDRDVITHLVDGLVVPVGIDGVELFGDAVVFAHDERVGDVQDQLFIDTRIA